MEKDPKKSEEDMDDFSDYGRKNMSNWLQENLRMLVSIVIVIAIAGGIYAYSKRTQAPTTSKESAVTQEGAEGKISVIGGETEKKEEASTSGEAATQETAPSTEAQAPSQQTPAPETQISKETDSSFVETAAKGDSTTKLARRALANYLEKNSDTSLTAEHKIFIEDFLRRQVKNGRIRVGDSREFSKDMIAKAIEKSKGLNEKQLKNLEKYSTRVPGLK